MMEPRIETLIEKKMIGKRMAMSFSDNRTVELWREFMPGRKEIRNSVGADLYSIEVYPPFYWNRFNPDAVFDKWAAVEVTDFGSVPDTMETITVPNGQYAVFVHRGPASEGPKTYQYIFLTWLPGSGFSLDARPHFAVMGETNKKDAADSEEELWIPIKPKQPS